jgi:putative aldouronate transport system permease protein
MHYVKLDSQGEAPAANPKIKLHSSGMGRSIMVEIQLSKSTTKSNSFLARLSRDLKKNKELYLLVLPVIIFYLIFHYKPMYGAVIAFKNFSPNKGIWGSPWVGLKHFQDFFGSFYFPRVLKNTLTISITSLAVGFPAPIFLALLINELRLKWFTKTVQTITYLPHFISLVVICGIIKDFVANDGVIGQIVAWITGNDVSLLTVPQYFVPIFVSSGIWQEIGWGSIIYLAALAGIDQEQYEAAAIDGANRWRQTLNITIPGIMPTIIILFILRMGGLLGVGFEKVILLYNESIYETSDVISSFVYRRGLQEFSFSYSSAVGLFNAVINFIFIFSTNWISRKVNETSLW